MTTEEKLAKALEALEQCVKLKGEWHRNALRVLQEITEDKSDGLQG